MKKVVIFILVVFGTGFLGYSGIRHFAKTIYYSYECEGFDIDNLEVRTGINIPSILDVTCDYDEDFRIKTSTFVIDLQEVDIVEYIAKNNLQLIGNTTDFDDLKQVLSIPATEEDLYVVSGERTEHTWKVLLDKSSGDLGVIMKLR